MHTLYVANFPSATTADQLRALIGEAGGAASIDMGVDEISGTPFARAEMGSAKAANQVMRALNGHVIAGQRLAVSYAEVHADRKLMNRERKAIEAVIKALGETEKVPVRRLTTMGLLCGAAFMEALLAETESVEAQGGIMTADGARRRTKGGVFFYLARGRVAPPVRQIIYNRKGKLPPPEEERAAVESPEVEEAE